MFSVVCHLNNEILKQQDMKLAFAIFISHFLYATFYFSKLSKFCEKLKNWRTRKIKPSIWSAMIWVWVSYLNIASSNLLEQFVITSTSGKVVVLLKVFEGNLIWGWAMMMWNCEDFKHFVPITATTSSIYNYPYPRRICSSFLIFTSNFRFNTPSSSKVCGMGTRWNRNKHQKNQHFTIL